MYLQERKQTSPSSIEVLDGVDESIPDGKDASNNTSQSVPAASMITSNTMSGSGSTMMQESSSSGSLVNSVILNTKQVFFFFKNRYCQCWDIAWFVCEDLGLLNTVNSQYNKILLRKSFHLLEYIIYPKMKTNQKQNLFAQIFPSVS